MSRALSRAQALSILAAAALALGAGPGGCFRATERVATTSVPAQRGTMRISVVQRGNLESKNAVSIKSEIERESTILFLIAEGERVEPGDLLVELDVSELVDRRTTQEISVQNADAAYTKAAQQYEIQKSENESEIDAAVNAVQFAELDLKKYLEGDWPQELQVAAEEIVLAEEEKARAEERLNWSRNLAEKGFLTRTELEGDELAFNRSGITLQQAIRAKELLIEFDNPRNQKQLEADLEEARRELDRTRMRAAARLVDYDAALKTSEKKLGLERDNLTKMQAQIDKARVVSPVAGMAVHTREDRGRFGSSEPLQEGSQVYERQEILTIPTTEGMVAEASVHESVLKQIVPGLPCTVRVDALPGVEFQGSVEFVAPLPDKTSWWANPDQRLFRTDIAIAGHHPDMRPGMSCAVEFLIDEIDSALQVPLQAVLVHEGATICFVDAPAGPVQRKVEVGRRNETNVEIVAGLAEGELVLLSPPQGFTPKGAAQDERRRPKEEEVPEGMRPPGVGERSGEAREETSTAQGSDGDRERPERERGEGQAAETPRNERGERGEQGDRADRSGERKGERSESHGADARTDDARAKEASAPKPAPGAGSGASE